MTDRAALVERLFEIVKKNPGGYPAPDAVREIREICGSIRDAIPDAGLSTTTLLGNAEILYSDRKHAHTINPAAPATKWCVTIC